MGSKWGCFLLDLWDLLGSIHIPFWVSTTGIRLNAIKKVCKHTTA